MVIDGKDYKINVLILLMESEIDVTILTIETLLESIEADVTLSVLLNGGKSQKLRKMFSDIGCLKYYESDINLGVAGGRNYLLSTMECKKSDIIMSIDNDVIPPLDYIRGLATFLLSQDKLGIIGPVIADIKDEYIRSQLESYYGVAGAFGNNLYRITSKEIREFLVPKLTSERLFHMGIYPDYYYAYFSVRPYLYSRMKKKLRKLGIKWDHHPVLRFNKDYIDMIKNGARNYRVSNVGGGACAYRRQLLDDVGKFDDRFNPYGFEDVDFAIRAIKAGYRNYITTDVWLLHGTDTRHKERNIYKVMATNYKSRTILSSLLFPWPFYKFAILKQIIIQYLIHMFSVKKKPFALFKAMLEGYKQGLKIVKETKSQNTSDRSYLRNEFRV